MRCRYAFATLLTVAACCSSGLMAEETTNPVNPFSDSAPVGGGISASVSDEPETAPRRPDGERTGFSLPKFSLPKLPKPNLPKLTLPKMQMPKLPLPNWTKKETTSTARRPSNEPSAFEKFNTGTKNVLAKTRDTLMPWTVKDAPRTVRSPTGSSATTGLTRSRVASNRGGGGRESTTKKKSIFSSWLGNSDEPEVEPVRTTTDFLKQERPHFGN